VKLRNSVHPISYLHFEIHALLPLVAPLLNCILFHRERRSRPRSAARSRRTGPPPRWPPASATSSARSSATPCLPRTIHRENLRTICTQATYDLQRSAYDLHAIYVRSTVSSVMQVMQVMHDGQMQNVTFSFGSKPKRRKTNLIKR